jgi:tetratricopeptide (TPR) repeat protein
LEAGFNDRAAASFTDPNDLGFCALALGRLRDNRGDREGTLGAYNVSLESFRQTGERLWEGTTLNNIAVVYDAQGRYEAALSTYEAALAVFHEVGDRAGEGTTLTNIGLVYRAQRWQRRNAHQN